MCFTVWSIVMLQVIYVLSATHSAKSTDSMYVLSFVIKAAESIHFFATSSSLLPSNTTYWVNVESRVTFCVAVITPIVFFTCHNVEATFTTCVFFFMYQLLEIFLRIHRSPETAAGLNEPLITGIYIFFSRVNAWIMTFHKVKDLSRDFSNKL